MSKKIRVNDLEEFVTYLKNPRSIILHNLLAGIFHGIGGAIGATLILAGLVYLLNIFIDFPLIGTYLGDIKQILESSQPLN